MLSELNLEFIVWLINTI